MQWKAYVDVGNVWKRERRNAPGDGIAVVVDRLLRWGGFLRLGGPRVLRNRISNPQKKMQMQATSSLFFESEPRVFDVAEDAVVALDEPNRIWRRMGT